MSCYRHLQFHLAAFALLGLIVPAPAWAQESRPVSESGSSVPDGPSTGNSVPSIVDVALTADGTFQGVLLDGQGQPVEAAVMTIRRGEEQVAQRTTDAEGRFSVAGLTSGVYGISSPQGESLVRVWSQEAAPPTAVTTAVIVNSDAVMRGQFGFLDPVGTSLILLGVATVVLSAITLGEVNDVKSDVNRINRQLSN